MNEKEFWEEMESWADEILSDFGFGAIEEINKLVERAYEGETVDKEKIKALIEELSLDKLHEEDLNDKIHETADSHEWVIYTHQAWGVARLMRCDNDTCEMFDEIRFFDDSKNLDILITRFAYCAIVTGIQAEMGVALERKKTEMLKEVEEL